MENEKVEAKESPITFKGYVKDSYLLDVSTPRFGTGEAKCTLKDTVRGCDLYIIDDVTNYSIEYTVCGGKKTICLLMTTMQDIKRVIAAAAGKAKKITVIMPSLYKN
ncbi:MAG: ribose-phosphate pyrophosphokinase-like domain-containing protein [Eubacterium sp.]